MSKSTHRPHIVSHRPQKTIDRPHITTHRPFINYNSIFAIKNERFVFRQLIKTGKQGVFVFNYLLSIKELSLRNGLGMRKTIPSTLYQRYGLDMVGVKGFEPPTSCSQTHVLASCSFRYAPSGAFSVLFGTLVPTVSMWLSSVCGRRCGQKYPLPKRCFQRLPREDSFCVL